MVEMDNRGKYRFDDFTLVNYQRLLELALSSGYEFSDYMLTAEMNQRLLVWRHDVEFSVHRAFKMARMEQQLGVKAHYFIQIHSEFYNTFEREIYDLLLRIRDLGHHIGLHFDAHFWQVGGREDLERGLNKDKRILEDLLEIEVKSFSFHNTTPGLLALNDLHYAGLLNVYAKQIRDTYRYCTDSTGIWRYERLEDILKDKLINRLQVLTHDGMWQDEPMAPRQRVLQCVNMRAHRIMDYYDNFLSKMGQANIDEK